MKNFLYYLENINAKTQESSIENENIEFASKIITGENISKLEILNKENISFLFFDTETSGLISNKSGSVISSQKSNPAWNKRKKELLKELFIKYKIPKEDQEDATLDIKKYVASLQAENKGTEINLKEILPELYLSKKDREQNDDEEDKEIVIKNLGLHTPKNKAIADEYYNEFLQYKLKGEVDLIEFYGILYGISYNNSKKNIRHRFFSPTEELTDEIKNLIHWDDEKEIKANKGTFKRKAQSIIGLFKKGILNEKLIIAGHNILYFDIPLLLLYFKRLDQLNNQKTQYFETLISILKNPKTHIFDTMNLKKILTSIQGKVPYISLEKNKKQVVLQNILGVKNVQQHTAAGDVSALIEIFERIMVLSIFINNDTTLNDLNNFIEFLKQKANEGIIKDSIIDFILKDEESILFKKLEPIQQEEIIIALKKIRASIKGEINKINIIKNKNEKLLDMILINIINNAMEIIKENFSLYEEIKDIMLINEAKLKKRDKLPGRVRKFAKRNEVKDPASFLKYFMKTKNKFLDKDYPIGYAIAMAYKISKLKFNIGK
jgi:hypothetical protein